MRVITDEGDNLGEMDKNTALNKAQEMGLDLILINPTGNPPVAKIMAWSKFKYEQSKKHKGSGSKGSELKEMWFAPNIELGDLQHKVERVKEFLSKNHKVKITIRAKRFHTPAMKQTVLRQVLERLVEDAELEGDPKSEGTNISVYLKPKK